MVDIAFNGTGLDHTFIWDRTVEFDVNSSNFREPEFFVMIIEGEPTLRVGEGVIAVFLFKTWVTGLFPLLKTPKKIGEGLIQSSQYVLQYL